MIVTNAIRGGTRIYPSAAIRLHTSSWKPTIVNSTRKSHLSTTTKRSSGRFDRPAPPSLPPKEQREFERLQKEKANQSPFIDPKLSSTNKQASSSSSTNDPEAGQLHPDIRRKPQPDFEGDVNPVTGEVGGPKKDPLTWEREWTYGGRATDF
ncbi:hypothetical protein IE53DRAFT_365023 [Violaceomyces palustris]|uniref:Uncharacterized protein n=1 Tax=Violaceomyces palustris TaxID=1673888 RepID=A0ACD0NMD5_9BASI|nr:hypothetical protein IE53DRAFT_365023 [Violaceomyces palustris]